MTQEIKAQFGHPAKAKGVGEKLFKQHHTVTASASQRLLRAPISRKLIATPLDLAWAAGFFDGEGCIHIARQTYGISGRRPTYRMRLDISQNNISVLQEFEWAVGIRGRHYTLQRTAKQNRPCYSLAFDGVAAFEVLERLIDMLRRKKCEAELAAEFRRECDIHRHFGSKGCPPELWRLRFSYYKKMIALK